MTDRRTCPLVGVWCVPVLGGALPRLILIIIILRIYKNLRKNAVLASFSICLNRRIIIRLLYKQTAYTHTHTWSQDPIINHRFVSFLSSLFISSSFYTCTSEHWAFKHFLFSYISNISKIVVSSSALTSHRIVINQRAFRPTNNTSEEDKKNWRRICRNGKQQQQLHRKRVIFVVGVVARFIRRFQLISFFLLFCALNS